ncbi:MAG: hypothetical protein K2Y14_07310 [Burkholderiales bacterium]|nr:hypothetical protein [Burkholderiales bacterium]
MNKLLIILLLGVSSVYADQQILMSNIESNGIMTKVIASATISKSTNPAFVGGWYPVFFNQYSDIKIQHIIMRIKNGKVSKLIVSYDKNQVLAKQIVTTIQATTDFNVQLEHVELVDDTAQYNHDQVVVTVYTKREN